MGKVLGTGKPTVMSGTKGLRRDKGIKSDVKRFCVSHQKKHEHCTLTLGSLSHWASVLIIQNRKF